MILRLYCLIRISDSLISVNAGDRNNDMSGKVSISVIILTYNEEANIEYALKSVSGWASEIFIVDSYSVDGTLEIAKGYTDRIYQHTWEGFAGQRNWAIDNLPIRNMWILFLDADEMLSNELKREIEALFENGFSSDISAFTIGYRIIFMGKWLKHGASDIPQITLVASGQVRWLLQGEREPCEVKGKVRDLKGKIWHDDRRGLHVWIDKHNKYSSTGALDLFNRKIKTENPEIVGSFKHKLWDRLPLFIRPFLYFSYRYIVRLGFLDGTAGFTYAFLQALWFRLLIDAKYYEMEVGYKEDSPKPSTCK